MMTVLYICGIVFVICAYRRSQSNSAEGNTSVSSAFSASAFPASIINPLIPLPASAGAIRDPYPNSVRCRTVQDDTDFFPVYTLSTHRQIGPGSIPDVFMDRSLLFHKFREKCKE